MSLDHIGGLLAATKEDDDWSPWLVLADALTERGDVRGELIRVQHRLATGRATPEAGGRLADWSIELQTELEEDWAGELPGEAPPGLHFGWDRGFVRQAFVRRVADDVIAYLDTLHHHPLGRGLFHVSLLAERPTPALLERLLTAPFARGARSWTFAERALGPSHARVVAQHLTHARSLDLRANALGDGGLITLAETAFASLETFNVGGNGFGSEGLHALASAPWPSLRHLLLMSVAFDEDQARALAGAVYAPPLEGLQLPNCQLGPRGAQAMFETGRPRLKWLGLAFNQLGDHGVQGLRPRALPALEVVSLVGNDVTISGARLFLGAGWPRLLRLDLRANPIDAADCEELARDGLQVIGDP